MVLVVKEVNLVAILTFAQEALVVNQEACHREVSPAVILTFAQEVLVVNQVACHREDNPEAIQTHVLEAQVPVETRETYSAIL